MKKRALARIKAEKAKRARKRGRKDPKDLRGAKGALLKSAIEGLTEDELLADQMAGQRHHPIRMGGDW